MTEEKITLFDHPKIQVYAFEDVPLREDIFLMDEKWIVEFEAAMMDGLNGGDRSAYQVGYYSRAAARAILPNWVELTWYPNIYDRFHQVQITLPRSEFVTCIGSWQYDYKPIIFVRDEWHNDIYLRNNAVFALIDAIGVKEALAAGRLTHSRLSDLRNRIDEIATRNESVAFVSFADSLLLKTNYTVGHHNSGVKYTYEPERLLRLLPELRDAYQTVLGLDIYAVVTQGSNAYYDDDLLHISGAKNHISLNSLGLPFAQTMAIEHSARTAIKSELHLPAEVYLDVTLYYSLRFNSLFAERKDARFRYDPPMGAGPSLYIPVSIDTLINSLEAPRPALT